MLFLCTSVAAHPRIKHVIVLYEENRAFDHFLGWQSSLDVDGAQPAQPLHTPPALERTLPVTAKPPVRPSRTPPVPRARSSLHTCTAQVSRATRPTRST